MTMRRIFPLLTAAVLLLSACNPTEDPNTPQENLPYDYNLEEYLELADYRGLIVPQSELIVSEGELEAQIQSDFAAETRLYDRPVESGDRVNLNYLAIFDGKQYDDDTENGFFLTLGENALGIPGFDEGLVGATPGDSIALDLAFPEDYEKTPEYAGKDVSFIVNINYIALDLPELTDALVQSYTTYDTVEEYLDGMRKMLADVKEVRYLWQTVVESSRVLQYPEKEYENYYNEYLAAYREMAAQNGMTLSELVSESGATMDDFYNEADRTVKAYIKEDLIVYAIARREELTVSEEEYEQGVDDYYLSTASEYYLSKDLMEETLGKEILEPQILASKVLDLICSSATREDA